MELATESHPTQPLGRVAFFWGTTQISCPEIIRQFALIGYENLDFPG